MMILHINSLFLRACAAFGCAWVFWRFSRYPDFEIFVINAVFCALGGVVCTSKGLAATVRYVRGRRKWASYRGQGSKPKADDMTNVVQLRNKGLLK